MRKHQKVYHERTKHVNTHEVTIIHSGDRSSKAVMVVDAILLMGVVEDIYLIEVCLFKIKEKRK